MPPPEYFDDAPDDTRAALMQATYLALCEHGYADLTIERIGEEFEKSKSLLYHHYDGKDELLVEFLDFVLDEFETDVADEAYDDAYGRLQAIFDHVLAPTFDEDRRTFTSAVIELRANAPHSDDYREQFTQTDQFFRAHVADVIRDGIAEGTFRDVDPERTAAMLVTTINGAMLERVTTDDSPATMRATREELDAYVESHLLERDAE